MKILLWDQNLFHSLLFKDLCAPVAEVVSVASKEEAANALKSEAFDLVFLGDMEKIKEAVELGLPVIAHASEDTENLTMLTLGAKATLKKAAVFDPKFLHFLENSRDCFCP